MKHIGDSNYPSGTSSKDFDEKRNATYILTIEDVLSKGPINIRGLDFDAHVTAHLIRKGFYGRPEVVEIEIRSVNLFTVDTDGNHESFDVTDAPAYKRSYQKAFEAECER